MSEQNGASRIDRIERALDLLIDDHVQFREEHKLLLAAQVVLTDRLDRLTLRVDKLAEQGARTDERLEKLGARTDERLKELAALGARTDERLKELAALGARTDERLKELAALGGRTDERLNALITVVDGLVRKQS